MPPGATEPPANVQLSSHGLFVILSATAIALLATPLVSPAMPEIARVFAENAQNEPFAKAILNAISILPGDPSVIFLVKFILLSIPALFIILGAPVVGWLGDNVGRKRLLNSCLLIFGISGAWMSRLTALASYPHLTEATAKAGYQPAGVPDESGS